MHCGPENGSILRLLQHTGPGNGFPPSLHGDRKIIRAISANGIFFKFKFVDNRHSQFKNFQRSDLSFEYLIIKENDVDFEISGGKNIYDLAALPVHHLRV